MKRTTAIRGVSVLGAASVAAYDRRRRRSALPHGDVGPAHAR